MNVERLCDWKRNVNIYCKRSALKVVSDQRKYRILYTYTLETSYITFTISVWLQNSSSISVLVFPYNLVLLAAQILPQ